MYLLYSKTENDGTISYKNPQPISLFGCNNGKIPDMLRKIVPKDQQPDYFWHIRIKDFFPEQALIINLHPDDKEKLSLYELMDVWGHSERGWTPIMFHLQGIFVEYDRKNLDETDPTQPFMGDIKREKSKIDDPIFTMMHLYGSYVENGQLVGKWTPPRPGSTNSVLLWPKTLQFFLSVALRVLAEQ